jgi:hypothetical protein
VTALALYHMKFEFSIDIPAPRELVWSVAQDSAHRHIWDPRVARYTVHGVPGPGVQATILVRAFIFRPRVEVTLTHFDPPRQSILRIDKSTSRLLPGGGGTWVFEETAEGTRFTTRFNLKYEGRLPAPEALIRWGVSWDTRRSLRNLRTLATGMTNDQPGRDTNHRIAAIKAAPPPER